VKIHESVKPLDKYVVLLGLYKHVGQGTLGSSEGQVDTEKQIGSYDFMRRKIKAKIVTS
jgi:hypothetical protein